jgi:capsular polysaccharide biosynthesis protein
VRRPIPAPDPKQPNCIAVNEQANKVWWREYEIHPELFLASIPRGRVLGPNGVVITPDNLIVEESAWVGDGSLEEDRVVQTLLLPKAETLSGQYFNIAGFSSQGYAHWILDALPRLSMLCYVPGPQVKIIVSNPLNSWQRESLLMLGIDLERLIVLDHRHLQLELLYLPSYIGQPGRIHPFGCRWLRKKFVSNKKTTVARRRLYITRRLARRRIVNETELEPILDRYGFEVIDAAKLDVAEQIQLFSQAEAIAGAHGAGLTNIVFAPVGCKVFELFGDTCVRPMYYQLAEVVGHTYWYLVGTAIPNRENNESGFDDMRIAPEKFEQTLSRMLAG